MNVQSLEKNFSKMGAAIEFENPRERPRFVKTLQLFRTNPKGFAEPPKLPNPTLDVIQRGKEEIFVIDTFDNPKLKVEVIDIRPKERHLLLMIKDQESSDVLKVPLRARRTALVRCSNTRVRWRKKRRRRNGCAEARAGARVADAP